MNIYGFDCSVYCGIKLIVITMTLFLLIEVFYASDSFCFNYFRCISICQFVAMFHLWREVLIFFGICTVIFLNPGRARVLFYGLRKTKDSPPV